MFDEKPSQSFAKKTHFVESLLQSDIVSKSTTESSVTTVVSTLTKSSDDEQKSVLEDGTSADFSKISGADLAKDPSKTSAETKDDFKIEEQGEERGTPDLSKKSMDLTKDYSKSSIDSKDTSRDFATNELSKDSTVDLTKDYSKASIESVRDNSKSIDEKTFSEDHSSYDVSKTLASDASEGFTASRDFVCEERSTSKVVSRVSTSSSQGTSVMTESKIFSEHDDKLKNGERHDSEKDLLADVAEISKQEDIEDDQLEKEDEVPDMSELNRRCSNLLEDISHGALIKIDSSHVTHGKQPIHVVITQFTAVISNNISCVFNLCPCLPTDFVSKFSKTPPPSPVDLINRDKSKADDGSGDKQTGLHLKGTKTIILNKYNTASVIRSVS